jgi:hypothetical protein
MPQPEKVTEQANLALQQRDRAERRFADVQQLSNALLNDITPKIENLQGATEARRSIVAQSLKYLDSLANEASDDLSLQSELATAYEKVGDLQGNPTNPNIDDLAGAIASYEKAQKICFKLLENDPHDFEGRRLAAANHQSLGNLRWQSHELAVSTRQTELDKAERIYAEPFQADSTDTVSLRNQALKASVEK